MGFTSRTTAPKQYLCFFPRAIPSPETVGYKTATASSHFLGRATESCYRRFQVIAKAALRHHDYINHYDELLSIRLGSYLGTNASDLTCLLFHLPVATKVAAPMVCSKNLLGHNTRARANRRAPQWLVQLDQAIQQIA